MPLVSKTFKKLFGELQTGRELFGPLYAYEYVYLNLVKDTKLLYISKVIQDENITKEVAITNECLATNERLEIIYNLHNQLNTQW